MIERLVHALRLLAAPADVQLAADADFATHADRLALDYADALRLAADCPQLGLAAEQLHALERLDDALDPLVGAAGAPLRTEAAVRDAPEWATVRARARQARDALDVRDTQADLPSAPP